jgi:hypothetical protein
MTDTVRVVAKLLAGRRTPQEEVPDLVRGVHAALARLAEAPAAKSLAEARPRAAAKTRPPAAPRARRRQPLAAHPEANEPMAAPPAPKLVRRAEVVAPAPAASTPFEMPIGVLRGLVKWYDMHQKRGALRLPGHAGDVPVEAALLEEIGITRLYKGQEVDATLSGDAPPRLVRLSLPGGAAPSLATSGIVRGRHAKPVVVELKREALKRAAARAEAELVLRPGRAR